MRIAGAQKREKARLEGVSVDGGGNRQETGVGALK